LSRKGSLAVSFVILAVFAYFLYEYDVIPRLAQMVRRLHPVYLFLSLLVYCSVYFFRAKRFALLFPQIKTLDLSAVIAVHTFFNNVMPFRSGEASFPIILKKLFGVDASVSSTALTVARLLDLFSLALLFLVSALFVAAGRWELMVIPAVALVAILLFAFLAFKLVKLLKGRFAVFATVFAFLTEFVSLRKVFYMLGLSVAIWVFKFLSFYFILRAAGVNLNYFQTVFASTFAELTTVLPVHSVGGFGTFEAGLVGGFALLGFKGSYALTVAFYFHLLLLLMSGLLAFGGWLYLSRRLR
jgi:uncharacterized membrane protein YbhN (UPF0104 family)